AEGSVIASGLTTINLGSSTGQGGTLTIIAGYDFTPATNGQLPTPDTSTPYILGAPSTTGGDIDLAKVTINTSSTAPVGSASGTNGGSIMLLASSGGTYGGNIVVGAVNTSSKNGFGGAVQMIGPGGIVVNGAITATGKSGGGSAILSGSPAAII